MKMSGVLCIGSKTLAWSFKVMDSLDTETGGIPTTTQDMRHVLFLDYDRVDISLVRRDYAQLAEDFSLGTAQLLTTDRERGNWHLINPERFTWAEAQEIMESSHADQAHATSLVRSQYRNGVLRTLPKGSRPAPAYYTTIQTRHHTRTISLAHARFLRDHLEVPAERITWTPNDGFQVLLTETYMTRENSHRPKEPKGL